MMTRRALTRHEENKLQLGLQELKVSKELCSQLNNERDAKEKELLEVLKNNDKLKSQISMLYVKFNDVEEERNRLQIIVDKFDECSVKYEQALRRTTTLERELRDAHLLISELEEAAHNTTTFHTHSLFEELVDNAPQLVTAATQSPCVTIDLTNDTLTTQRLVGCSKNFKKAFKLISVKKTSDL